MKVLVEPPTLLVGFDVESTGLDTRNDEAISYGFAEFFDGELVSMEEFFVLPDVQIHPAAERVHGVSYEHLRKKFREGDALSSVAGATRATQRLLDYQARGATFVGANPKFDYSMLDSTLRRHGSGGLMASGFDLSLIELIDVVAFDLQLEPDRSRRPRRGLSYLCEYYGVTAGEHHASLDARASCEVLMQQIAHGRVARELAAASTPKTTLMDRMRTVWHLAAR